MHCLMQKCCALLVQSIAMLRPQMIQVAWQLCRYEGQQYDLH